MFKIDTSETYKHPVNVRMIDTNGKQIKQSFTAVFHRLPQHQIDDLSKAVSDGSINDDQFVDEILAGWEGVVDQNGDAVAFNDVTKSMILDINPVRSCIINAWGDSLAGIATKN